jgi:hypothetical protein
MDGRWWGAGYIVWWYGLLSDQPKDGVIRQKSGNEIYIIYFNNLLINIIINIAHTNLNIIKTNKYLLF